MTPDFALALAHRTSASYVPFIMPITPPLSASFGYGIVLGLGFAFAVGMMTVTFVLKRYHSEVQTSEMEMFSTAGRTVKTGLVASAFVSSWTWAATLLQSSGVAYRYGVSGPFWFVLPQPIKPLFKPVGSPERLSRNSRAPPESMSLT